MAMCSFPSKPNEPARAWITNSFLPLLQAPYPTQRMEACGENTSLPANKSPNSQYKPLCVPSAFTRRDTGNFLTGATAELTLQHHPQTPKWPLHMFSLPGFPANILFKGSARTSRAFCSQVVWFVPFQIV